MKHSYTNEELQKAISLSFSIANVLKLLGLAPKGGNYRTIKKRIKSLNIDTSHFTGQGWNKNKVYKRYFKSVLLADILKKNVDYSSHKLKNRLLYEGLKQRKCEQCELTEWNDKPLSLELHHIDGDYLNNTIENLLLLCPNCHSCTENYRGKNKKLSASAEKPRVERVKFNESFVTPYDANIEPSFIKEEGAETRRREPKSKIHCPCCGIDFIPHRGQLKFCSRKCYILNKSKSIPNQKQLEIAFNTHKSFLQVGKFYGVSDNAVRRWCTKYNILDKVKT
jgi:hypothetical protein